MRPLACLLSLILLATAVPARAALDAAWRALPQGVPAESLLVRLRIMEARPVRGVRSGDAAFALGQYHYARGEYRQAADAFLRALPRSAGEERGEMRYWSGLASLALGDGPAARLAFAEAGAGRRSLAQLGIAEAWELERHPEKSYDVLRALLAGDAGEAAPAALDRMVVLARAMHRDDEAKKARERLVRDYPGSVEAVRVQAAPFEAPAEGAVAVQIGVFSTRARAAVLAQNARRAGFAETEVVTRRPSDGASPVYCVRLGRYANREAARAAGERVQHALGVGWQVEKP